MKRLSNSIAGLALVLVLVASFGFKCSVKDAVDISLPHLCNLLSSSKDGVAKDIGTGVCAYDSDRSEGTYQRTVNAINAALARHDLSASTREIILLAEDIFKFYAPATLAEMDPNSEDARAAKREVEQKVKRLEKLLGK
jgi:hypothetical protein